jgi:hypothetical protein
MPTIFIVQGTVISKALRIFDVASMNSLDAISVLFFGSLTANYMYQCLAKKGVKFQQGSNLPLDLHLNHWLMFERFFLLSI